MGVDGFGLRLDDPSRQYSSGENLSGKVFLKISDEDETTTELTVRFFGAVTTFWVEYDTGYGEENAGGYRSYDAYENPFDFAVRLLGDGVNRVKIPPGDHIFPFVFQVPVCPLPVTCNLECGTVGYGVEARIKKPWYSTDEKTQVVPVTLYSKVDLNLTPAAGNPLQVADVQEIGSCCCTKPCFLRSFTPRMGFCVGEVIPLVVELDNKSNTPIYRISATLHQVWTLTSRPSSLFHDGHSHKTITIAMQAVGCNEEAGPKQVTKWEAPLAIPPTAAPTSVPGASELIQMEYIIDVSATTAESFNSKSFHVTHPIIVGTIPLISPSVVTVQIPKYNEAGGLA